MIDLVMTTLEGTRRVQVCRVRLRASSHYGLCPRRQLNHGASASIQVMLTGANRHLASRLVCLVQVLGRAGVCMVSRGLENILLVVRRVFRAHRVC